ncbi:MAG: hypothetical protein WDO24_01335 [Pseudomonadota bacterium]
MKANPDFWFNPDPDGNSDYEGKRYKAINVMLAGRRDAAKAKLISESPALLAALKEDINRGRDVLANGGNAVVGGSDIAGVKLRP